SRLHGSQQRFRGRISRGPADRPVSLLCLWSRRRPLAARAPGLAVLVVAAVTFPASTVASYVAIADTSAGSQCQPLPPLSRRRLPLVARVTNWAARAAVCKRAAVRDQRYGRPGRWVHRP